MTRIFFTDFLHGQSEQKSNKAVFPEMADMELRSNRDLLKYHTYIDKCTITRFEMILGSISFREVFIAGLRNKVRNVQIVNQ